MTELGSVSYGYLGLVVSAEKYTLLTGHVFTPHPNPGPILTFPANLIEPQIAQVSITYKEQLRLY